MRSSRKRRPRPARLAEQLAGAPPLLVGVPLENPASAGRPLVNAAVLLQGGTVGPQFIKSLLPTYDVFDEDRYFEPARGRRCSSSRIARRGVRVCEDLWNDRDFWERPRYHHRSGRRAARPRRRRPAQPLGLAVLAWASSALREAMLAAWRAKHGVPVVYVNQVGGNDDLVFDGRSLVFAPDGERAWRAPRPSRPTCSSCDLDGAGGIDRRPCLTAEAEILRALVLGTRDYARKCGFRDAVLGLSGGIDSALTAVVAAEALGRDNVLGVLMPSPFSSRGSVDDARALAERLGIRTLTLPIAAADAAPSMRRSPRAFAGRAARRHRREHPGAHPRQRC